MTPTPEEQEAARKCAERLSLLLANCKLYMHGENTTDDCIKVVLSTLTSITQPLRDGVKELETNLNEAQQWIDSEPDWKDKFMANYQIVINENSNLLALLTSAFKWLERIENRRAEIPESVFDNCDPTPLLKKIQQALQQPTTTAKVEKEQSK